MELMIVVVITGVLAAIAIPTFGAYIKRAQTSEAVQFLGVIKLRQEAYRAEFGQYFICPNGVTDPGNIVFIPGDITVMKNGQSLPLPANACFDTLGAKPDGRVRFGYGWAAGTPGSSPGAVYGLPTPHDHYVVAQAVSDLDGNGVGCTFELTSFTQRVWFSPAKGWE